MSEIFLSIQSLVLSALILLFAGLRFFNNFTSKILRISCNLLLILSILSYVGFMAYKFNTDTTVTSNPVTDIAIPASQPKKIKVDRSSIEISKDETGGSELINKTVGKKAKKLIDQKINDQSGEPNSTLINYVDVDVVEEGVNQVIVKGKSKLDSLPNKNPAGSSTNRNDGTVHGNLNQAINGNIIFDSSTTIIQSLPTKQQFIFKLQIDLLGEDDTELKNGIAMFDNKTYNLDNSSNVIQLSLYGYEEEVFPKKILLSRGEDYEEKEVSVTLSPADANPQLKVKLERVDIKQSRLSGYEYNLYLTNDGNSKLYWTIENTKPSKEEGIGFCYNNENANCEKYGGLFNYSQAVAQCNKMKPGKWRLPSAKEIEKYGSLESGIGILLAGSSSSSKSKWLNKLGYYWLYQTNKESSLTNGKTALAARFNLNSIKDSISDYGKDKLFSCKCVREYDSI